MTVEPGEVLACLGQAVIATDLDGVVFYWNAAAENLYGWTAHEAIGTNIGALTVPDISAAAAEEIMAALGRGVAWSGGFPVRHKDGTIFTALVTDSGLYREGNLVGVVGVSSNLGTALRPLLEKSSDAALVLRPDAVITYASPAVTRLFGWPDKTLLGTSLTPLIEAEDRAPFMEYLRQVIARPNPYAPIDLRLRRGEDVVWAEAALTNMLDDPVVRGIVCNLRLNVRRAVQQAAELRAQQLEAALQSRLTIELAKGYLMGRDRLDADTAFNRLRTFARSHNLTVFEVARRLNDGVITLPS